MKTIGYGILGLTLLWCAALAQPKKGGNDEAALRAIEEKWDAAAVKGDTAALGALLADSFVSTSIEGHVSTKAEMLAEIKSGDVKYESSKTDELKVALYGTAAVVTGRWSGKVIEKGLPSETVERFTETFIKQNGQWRCVASHSSLAH